MVHVRHALKPCMRLLAGGLVQESRFAVLPAVQPWHCALLALVTMAPALVAVWRRPRPDTFAAAAAYACLCRSGQCSWFQSFLALRVVLGGGESLL
jgi:hypothetical protein